jgi:hypothetical protein
MSSKLPAHASTWQIPDDDPNADQYRLQNQIFRDKQAKGTFDQLAVNSAYSVYNL